MRVGDASRSRRFADPARQRWYAYHRSVRFASRMRGGFRFEPFACAGPRGVRCGSEWRRE